MFHVEHYFCAVRLWRGRTVRLILWRIRNAREPEHTQRAGLCNEPTKR
jgi:hypothetical protein